jgi:hypothetical protein
VHDDFRHAAGTAHIHTGGARGGGEGGGDGNKGVLFRENVAGSFFCSRAGNNHLNATFLPDPLGLILLSRQRNKGQNIHAGRIKDAAEGAILRGECIFTTALLGRPRKGCEMHSAGKWIKCSCDVRQGKPLILLFYCLLLLDFSSCNYYAFLLHYIRV